MSAATDTRTQRWQTGDPITNRVSGIQGFARWTNPRLEDGKRFLRVRISSGKRAGFETWENGDWILGQGAHELTCRDCGQPFRSNHVEDLWCPACQRSHAPNYDPHANSFAHGRARLRGNATRGFETPPRAVTEEEHAAAAEQRKREQDDFPF